VQRGNGWEGGGSKKLQRVLTSQGIRPLGSNRSLEKKGEREEGGGTLPSGVNGQGFPSYGIPQEPVDEEREKSLSKNNSEHGSMRGSISIAMPGEIHRTAEMEEGEINTETFR